MKDAFDYYLKAAELGQGMAMFEVARCYENGTGTSRDIKNAIHWYQLCSKSHYAASHDAEDRLMELSHY